MWLWSPDATEAALIVGERRIPMVRATANPANIAPPCRLSHPEQWWVSTEALPVGTRYHLEAVRDGQTVTATDPLATRLPEGVHADAAVWWPDETYSPATEAISLSHPPFSHVGTEGTVDAARTSTEATADAAHTGTDGTTDAPHTSTAGTANAERSAVEPSSEHRFTGRPLRGSLIYELHIGTFTPEGTLDAAAEQLGYLADLGVTMVELMPVNPFGGTRNWGYDGVNWFCVQESYGGPDALLRFVRAAHARGMGVCLDVVYNHFGPDGFYGGAFAPFTRPAPTGWGDQVNLIGPGSDTVRDLIVGSARRWFEVFGVDALRLDAVHALDDPGAEPILCQLQQMAEEVSATTGAVRSLIAESDQNDPRLTDDWGLAGQWSDDLHHAIHAAITDERHAYYCDFGSPQVLATVLERGWWHDGRFSSFRQRTHGAAFRAHPSALVVYTTTHDQTGNRAAGDRPSQNLSPRQLLAKAALVLTSPFTPMFFQGEEWGASTSFPFFCSHTDPQLNRATRDGRRAEFSWDPHHRSASVPDPADPATFASAVLRHEERASAPHDEVFAGYRVLVELRKRLRLWDVEEPETPLLPHNANSQLCSDAEALGEPQPQSTGTELRSDAEVTGAALPPQSASTDLCSDGEAPGATHGEIHAHTPASRGWGAALWRDDLGTPATLPHGQDVVAAGRGGTLPLTGESELGSGRWVRVIRSVDGGRRLVVMVNLAERDAVVPLPAADAAGDVVFATGEMSVKMPSGEADDGTPAYATLGPWATAILLT